MFKQALTCILLAGILISTAFTTKSGEENWTATIQLEGKGKTITLVSEAVYGGYNPFEKRIFLFGKHHMFQNQNENQTAQIYKDLFTTNASGQFQFELNGVQNGDGTEKPVVHSGNISFKKRIAISGTLQKVKKNGQFHREIVFKNDFSNLGIVMTEEAKQVMTGKFTLTFTSNK
jgi:hypothetical protein